MSGADLFEDGFPHGTREGYAKGCHGGACPEAVEGRRTCRDANMAYAGDQVYRHRVNDGMTPVQIAEAEAADKVAARAAGAAQRPAAGPVVAVPVSKPVAVPAPPSVPQPEAPAAEGVFYTEGEFARMRELHGSGMSDSAIAREIGRSQPQVSKRLRKMGLEPHGRMPRPAAVEPPEAVVEHAQEVRSDGILNELADARAEIVRLQVELDKAIADVAIQEAANGTLTGQLADAVRKAGKLEDDLVQLHLTRDVELSAAAHEPSGAELVSAPSAPVVSLRPVDDAPAVRAAVGLDIQQLGDALSVRLHGGEPVQLNLQFVDGALADVGVKIGA